MKSKLKTLEPRADNHRGHGGRGTSAKRYRKDEYNASFQRLLSSVQQTLDLHFFSSTGAQASLFRSSLATLRRSTTVMPRVNSLCVSMSMKCSLHSVPIVGSSAIAMATGSGRQIPSSPVCTL